MNYKILTEPEVPNSASPIKFNSGLISLVSIIILLAFSALNLIGSNFLATEGAAVSATESQIIALDKENHDLQVKIEDKLRLTALAESASTLGFEDTKSIVYVSRPGAVALR